MTVMNAPMISDTELEQIQNAFRRCGQETVEAIVQFRGAPDVSLIPIIVYGIIERYRSGENLAKLSTLSEDTRLIEDLGIDSLTMLEVVLSIEEALGIRIENEELMQIRTLGEVKAFVAQKSASAGDKKGATQSSSLPKQNKRHFSREEIVLILPQQHPFLFLDQASIEGDTVKAQYRITGEEYFLEGHFKGEPVFPASIMFEAMGQAACLWVLTSGKEKSGRNADYKHVLFGSMGSAHVYRKAMPGDTISFEVTLDKFKEPLSIFNCKAFIRSDKLAAVDELVIVFGEEPLDLKHPSSTSHSSMSESESKRASSSSKQQSSYQEDDLPKL